MYSKRRYKKASSRIRERGKFKKYLARFLKLVVLVAILSGIIFLIRADFLKVKEVRVSGAETVSEADIKRVVEGYMEGNNYFVVPRSNIIFVGSSELESILQKKFPRLSSVDVSKQINHLDVKLVERSRDFLWCVGGECFLMDRTGLVFAKAAGAELEGKLIFEGGIAGDPELKQFVSFESLENFLKLVDSLESGGQKIEKVRIESDERMIVKTELTEIIFDPQEKKFEEAGENALTIISDILQKNPAARIQYIDARFGTKVFYKLY